MINLKKWLGLDMYVSELDRFLKKYNQSVSAPSRSQQQEIDKHKSIQQKRDQEMTNSTHHHSIINDILN